MIDPERDPNLASVLFGVSPGAKHIRTVNNMNLIWVVILAPAAAFAVSLKVGFAYAILFLSVAS